MKRNDFAKLSAGRKHFLHNRQCDYVMKSLWGGGSYAIIQKMAKESGLMKSKTKEDVIKQNPYKK